MDRENLNIILPKKNNWITFVLLVTSVLFLWLWLTKGSEKIDTEPLESQIEQRNLTIDSINTIVTSLQKKVDSLKIIDTLNIFHDEQDTIHYFTDTTLEGKLLFFTERYRASRR